MAKAAGELVVNAVDLLLELGDLAGGLEQRLDGAGAHVQRRGVRNRRQHDSPLEHLLDEWQARMRRDRIVDRGAQRALRPPGATTARTIRISLHIETIELVE